MLSHHQIYIQFAWLFPVVTEWPTQYHILGIYLTLTFKTIKVVSKSTYSYMYYIEYDDPRPGGYTVAHSTGQHL